jgi:hypothetical protein
VVIHNSRIICQEHNNLKLVYKFSILVATLFVKSVHERIKKILTRKQQHSTIVFQTKGMFSEPTKMKAGNNPEM